MLVQGAVSGRGGGGKGEGRVIGWQQIAMTLCSVLTRW